MGSSGHLLQPSASMAALAFGLLVLSALPELAAAITRHYTFNVGSLQILGMQEVFFFKKKTSISEIDSFDVMNL